MMKQNYVTLNDGNKIPQFGDYLGAWRDTAKSKVADWLREDGFIE